VWLWTLIANNYGYEQFQYFYIIIHIAMRTLTITIIVFILGAGIGFYFSKGYGTSTSLEELPYFSVRPTVRSIDHGADPAVYEGPIRSYGSQEIAFLHGESKVRIYKVSEGKKELLHELDIDPEWFRSVWVTAYEKKSGSIPNAFVRHWTCDLGSIEWIAPFSSEQITSHPDWRTGLETPVLYYHFSGDAPKLEIPAREFGPDLAKLSQWMIESTSQDASVGFMLITVEVDGE